MMTINHPTLQEPEHITPRDLFAAAALIGLFAASANVSELQLQTLGFSGPEFVSAFPVKAFELADLMLTIREK